MKAYTLKIRGGIERDANGRKAGKGALIQEELSATLGVTQDQYLFQPIAILGGAENIRQSAWTEQHQRYARSMTVSQS